MSEPFEYRDGELYCEGVPVSTLADAYETPLYVYSRESFLDRYAQIAEAFASADPLICYSVKSNSNLSVLSLLKDAGAAFDVVTGGEIHRALKVGVDPKKIVYAGVGKTDAEIRMALEAGILMFNVESEAELANISRIAEQLGTIGAVALRVNPDVDPKTHTYTSTGKLENKFGIDLATASDIVQRAGDYPGVRIDGVHAHIGSPVWEAAPYEEALTKVVAFIEEHRSDIVPFKYLNTGGGFAIRYRDETPLPPSDYAEKILPLVKRSGARMIMEPGRFIAGPSGVMVVSVQYIKDNGLKRFVITDGAMNDLIRPALYGSYHDIWPVRAGGVPEVLGGTVPDDLTTYDVVGPVCESGDFFAQDRPLPDTERGDRLVLFCAGAYGFVMASNYNSRPRPAEVLVSGNEHALARRRETYDDLTAAEIVLDPGA